MKTLKKQNGLTMWGWLITLSMVGALGFQAMVLYTPLTNYFLCDSVIERKLLEDIGLKGEKNKRKIRDLVTISLARENIPYKVNKETFVLRPAKGGDLHATINFEERVELIGNIDFVVTYHRELVIGSGIL